MWKSMLSEIGNFVKKLTYNDDFTAAEAQVDAPPI